MIRNKWTKRSLRKLTGFGIALATFGAWCGAGEITGLPSNKINALAPVEMPTKVFFPDGAALGRLAAEKQLKSSNCRLSFDDSAMMIDVPSDKRGTIRIVMPEGFPLDASGFTRLAVTMENVGTTETTIRVTLKDPQANHWSGHALLYSRLLPGQAKDCNIIFPYDRKKLEILKLHPELNVFTEDAMSTKMKRYPGGFQYHWMRCLDPAKITEIQIVIDEADAPRKLKLKSIGASYPLLDPLFAANREKFFPFVDRYGQYAHADWPGKVKTEEDLKLAQTEEEKDLAAHPRPKSFSRFGGWADGPRLKATGAFRVEKYNGKWWFVDPEGYLFWSYGSTGVGADINRYQISGCEKFFADLPGKDSPLAQFYLSKAPAGISYSFTNANYFRKYGTNWDDFRRELTFRRITSFGFNTLGAWSYYAGQFKRPFPYMTILVHRSKKAGNFADVFDPDFKRNIIAAMKEQHGSTVNDPWCIGYFSDNELKYGAPAFYAEALFNEGPSAAKKELVKRLQSAYGDIVKLNQLLKTDYASWDAVAAEKKKIDSTPLSAITEKLWKDAIETYFKTFAAAIKETAPGRLYLGTRFHGVFKVPLAMATKYCDVVSFNYYEYNVGENDVRTFSEDKPTMVGEFHFCAPDRGMWGLGICFTGDQQDRAYNFERYMNSAFKNPICVGAHWFTFNSQPLTGRGRDGENFQTGIVDITDNPYSELRDSFRKMADKMYTIRSGK